FETILKNYSELHSSFLAFQDEGIGALGIDIDRLLDQDMEPALCSRNTLAGVQSRWSSNNHHVHRMRQEGCKIAVSYRVAVAAELIDFAWVRAINGCNLHTSTCPSRLRMRIADVSRADQANFHVCQYYFGGGAVDEGTGFPSAVSGSINS